MKNEEKSKGITLITLVITIVIMLILAGIAIAAVVNGEGLFSKTREATEIYGNAVQNENDKIQSLMNEIEGYLNDNQNREKVVVNSPKITEGMIPVKYDEAKENWVKADVNNTDNDWYNYNPDKKQWANIVTVKESGIKTRDYYLNTADVGEIIEMDDVLTFFVWIPRYAYSITDGYKEIMDGTTEKTTAKIDIKFLVNDTNKDINGKEYPTDYDATKLKAGDATPMIVHPAFKFGTEDLTGIWVAKFEASGVNDLTKTDINVAENWTNYVGNRSATSNTPVAVTADTVLTIKPSVPSWRDITIGEAQVQSMNLTTSTNYGWAPNIVDGHLIKNAEWGAVAYLCYSEYGSIPMANNCGTISTYRYNLITGAGPKTSTYEEKYDYDIETFIIEHSYSTENGKSASTTGNIYGIYDMNGGAGECVSSYLNNGNYSLKIGATEYFNGSAGTIVDSSLKTEYEKYWDKYEVGEEEKNNAIQISDIENLSQNELMDKNKYELQYNTARKRITLETLNNMIVNKGDAMYETISEVSFYGSYNSGTEEEPIASWAWFKEVPSFPYTNGIKYCQSWNGDIKLIGNCANVFITRGGMYENDDNVAGVITSSIISSGRSTGLGFRPVLAI